MNVLLDSTDFSKDWAYRRFREFIHTKSRITIIPLAYHDEWVRDKSEWYECYGKSEGRFYKSLINPFLDYGVQENNIRFINYYEDTKESLEIILLTTDIIYFVGGFPEKTVQRLKQLEMIKSVESFPGIIMGWSAGASIQAKNYFISPDKDYNEFSLHDGLNFITDFAVQVHFNSSKEQTESILEFMNNTGLKVYTLEPESAIIVEDGKIELIGNAKEFINQ